MKKKILLILVLIFVIECVPSFAASGNYPFEVTAEMTKASFWKTKNSDKVLLDSEGVKAANKAIIDQKGTYVYALDEFKEEYDAAALKESLADLAVIEKDLYIGEKKLNKELFYKLVSKAILCTGYSTKTATNKYAIATAETALLSMPVGDRILYSPTDTDNEIQSSALLLGEPFLVKQRCIYKGETFYYGYTDNCTGWVKSKDLAFCADKEEWLSHWQFSADSKDILVVTADSFILEQTLESPKTSQLILKQGTVLRLVPEEDIPELINNRGTWFSYVVYIPTRNYNGNLVDEIALISENNGVNVGYLPYTESNLLDLAFASLGNRYSWGNQLGDTDCSGYIRNIFRCFGLHIPRNTSWQPQVEDYTISLANMTDKEKVKLLKKLPAGTAVYFPGHAMIYVGMKDNVPYVISNTAMLADSVEGSEVEKQYSVILTHLTVHRANGSTWLGNLNAAVVYAPSFLKK